MKKITDAELIEKAKELADSFAPSKMNHVKIGRVGAALITDKGNIYTGTSVDASCIMGFCAEQGAIANMVAKKETVIKKIVAVAENGNIVPPCGKCREFIYQINEKNYNSDIIIGENKSVKLSKLLPDVWQKKFYC
jgi:cytidine deaminase